MQGDLECPVVTETEWGVIDQEQRVAKTDAPPALTRPIAVVHRPYRILLSPGRPVSSEHFIDASHGRCALQGNPASGAIARQLGEGARRQPVECGAVTTPCGDTIPDVPSNQRVVVVELDRNAFGAALALGLVVIQSAGDAPQSVGAFLVDHGVVVAAVATDEHAVSRDGDTARMSDGRGTLSEHVVAAGVLVDGLQVVELHDREAVLHTHVRVACEGSGVRLQGATVGPNAVAAATIEQDVLSRGLFTFGVRREHDDVSAVDGDAQAEVGERLVRRERQRLRGPEGADIGPGGAEHDQRGERKEPDAKCFHGETCVEAGVVRSTQRIEATPAPDIGRRG